VKFDGSSGKKPSTEARRYVDAVLWSMLEAELEAAEREHTWMFGGLDDEVDRRRVRAAIRRVQTALQRKASL
jgi:hypothetical protein